MSEKRPNNAVSENVRNHDGGTMKTRTIARAAGIAGMTLALFLIATPTLLMAADNVGTGDIGGDPLALTDSPAFTLDSTTLALVKRAFDSNGDAIASNSTLPRGTQVKFMIYVNNNTPVPINDVSIQDVLDATFAYVNGTIKVDNTTGNCAAAVCTALEEETIFDNTDDNVALNDLVDADVASYDGTDTIDVGDGNAANGTVNVAANTVYAVVFTVTMQ
jgi:uncharacterized repeat protein (TIGR01451 family)